MQKYCKTNGVLNKKLVHLKKISVCLGHYYFSWWTVAEVPSRALLMLKPRLVSAFQSKDQAKSHARMPVEEK